MQWNRLTGSTFQLTHEHAVIGTFIMQKGLARCCILTNDVLIFRKGFLQNIVMTNLSGRRILTANTMILGNKRFVVTLQNRKVYHLVIETLPFIKYKIIDSMKTEVVSYSIDNNSELSINSSSQDMMKRKNLYELDFLLMYLMIPLLAENMATSNL